MIDSHCHLADDAFSDDLSLVIDRARAAGVTGALCILDSASVVEQERYVRVRELWPAVRYAIGVHPHRAGEFTERLDDVEGALERARANPTKPCAIGEIGLDYHYDIAPREVQREVFRRQIRLARAWDVPVVIHTREADADTVSILEEEGQGRLGGVFHCFTGGSEMAHRVLDLGFHVSFSGIVTFRKSDTVREAARVVPLERLLVETDSPYLAPVPHRGKRNEPAWVGRVIDVLADVRGEATETVTAVTSASFEALFGAEP